MFNRINIQKRVIISIHVPKAGGTSLLHLLKQGLGADAVLEDSEDVPANPASRCEMDPEGYLQNRPREIPPHIRAIHGHFKGGKYDLIPHAFRLTFLRHPVDNLLSIYHYWRHIPEQPSPLHQYFLREKLDAVGLARLPLIRYLYSRTYFGGWDTKKLDFVGFYERRDQDLEKLSKILGIPMDGTLRMNPTSHFIQDKPKEEVSPRSVEKIRDLLADDIQLYHKLYIRFSR